MKKKVVASLLLSFFQLHYDDDNDGVPLDVCA